ncbi:MAG: hypothetical protein K6F88_01770 [Ruminococcus sp.]|nr:hypothetical protein [Ruminococcus sp.]
MSKLFKVSTAFVCICLMFFSTAAYAASESILTSDVTVKTDRLFEVKVGLKSGRTITAIGFSLKYNPKDIAVREPVCNISTAKVRFNDKNGKTDIIFLCSDGIKCSEFPTLFTMKYKKISGNNTKITISAFDCVDSKLINFTPPKSAVCSVKADAATSSESKRKGKSGGAAYDKDGSGDEDILETSDHGGYAENDEDEIETFSGDDEPWYLKILPIAALAFILLFFAILLYQNTLIKKAEKRREEEEHPISLNNDED